VTARKNIWVSLNASWHTPERTSKGCFNFKSGEISFSRTCVWHQTRDRRGKTPESLLRTIAMAKAWHVNMSNHALNRDDGAYLPFNNYSPKARWLSGNIHRDEVEVNIPRWSPILRRIIVLEFLHKFFFFWDWIYFNFAYFFIGNFHKTASRHFENFDFVVFTCIGEYNSSIRLIWPINL
jgi:hypothetical protein